MVTVSRHRMILAGHADAVRVALLGETSGWAGDGRSWWRTPARLRVLISHDPLLDRLVLELAADGDAAEAEAAALVAELPRVVSVIRFGDALDAFASAATAQQRAATLVPLAATLPDGSAYRARAVDAAVDAVDSPDSLARAEGVLAAAYLADEQLSGRVRKLAGSDPDPRVRALAARVASPAEPATPAGAARRIAFVAERVADQFVPFAAGLGWPLIAYQPGAQEESERWVWQGDPAVQVTLVGDIRLGRDYLIVNGLNATAADQAERLIRNRFPAVEPRAVLNMINSEPDDGARLLLLQVLAAAAPPRCDPRMLAVLAGLFRDPVTPLRGFAVGASVYYPWPELVPLLSWSADHDPDAAIRGLARIGLDAIRRAHPDDGHTDHA
jgi:hypothetical protein